MLVRRAVAVVRQRSALTGRALARGGAALWRRAADGGVALVRMFGQETLRVAHVAADDPVHPRLRGHREIAADVAEQRALGPREIVTVGGQARDHLLAGLQHRSLVPGGRGSCRWG